MLGPRVSCARARSTRSHEQGVGQVVVASDLSISTHALLVRESEVGLSEVVQGPREFPDHVPTQVPLCERLVILPARLAVAGEGAGLLVFRA